MQYDSGSQSENRYVIFLSGNNIGYLEKCSTVLIDGTFWCVPRSFKQLITFNVFLFGKFYPLVFILMSSKQESAYINAFNTVKNIVNVNFKCIVVDFEIGLKNSASSVFKGCEVYGCSYHFGELVWRNLQKCGLSGKQKTPLPVKTIIRRVLDLAFVPIVNIDDEYQKILNKANIIGDDKLNTFLEYFSRNFIGSKEKGALYEKDFWSVSNRIILNMPRTINCLEAWHKSFNFKCNMPHLNLGKFLEILRQEAERVRVTLIQARKQILLPDKDYKNEERIRQIVCNYDFYKNEEFYDNLRNFFVWDFEAEW